MNIFELSFVVSLIIGLVSGGMATKQHGLLFMILGVLIGAGIGFVCHRCVFCVSLLLMKAIKPENPPPKNLILYIPWWLINITSVIIMMASPLLTIFAIRILVTLFIK